MKNFRMSVALIVTMVLFVSVGVFGQDKNVNEICTGDESCKSGTCLKLRSGKEVCGTCSQSTFNSLAPKVDTYCKAFEDGWAPEKAPEYKAFLVDGRVKVSVYDDMLEKAKDCKSARVNLQNSCFKGGRDYDERDHSGQIKAIEASITRISKHKSTMISAKRVYYCSKSTYSSVLSKYTSKCDRLDLNRIKQKMASLKNDFNRGNEVDCDILIDYIGDCEECADAVDDLIKYGFKNSSSYTPPAFSSRKKSVEDVQIDLEELVDDVKGESLCD